MLITTLTYDILGDSTIKMSFYLYIFLYMLPHVGIVIVS